MSMIHLAGQYFLNHRLEPDELRRQVRELIAAGYQSIYGHARQGLLTPYFSDAWWDAIRVIVEECQKGGVTFSIWDEDYYPSPLAGGRLVWDNPEYSAQQLDFQLFETVSHGELISCDLKSESLLRCFAIPKLPGHGFGAPLDVTFHCGTVSSGWASRHVCHSGYSPYNKIAVPHWRTSCGPKHFALQWQPVTPGEYLILAVHIARPGGRHNSDILNVAAMKRFVELTHDEYVRRLGPEMFDGLVDASFMDEPAPSGIFPWTGNFAAEFTTMHGYDLLPWLAHLAVDIDDRSPLVRHHYRMTQMQLQCRSFLDVVGNWCHEHGIKNVGHLTRTEFLTHVAHAWPNELRCCKHLDLPCTDPLGAGVAWPDAAAYHTGLKVVSSAAHLFGKQQAGSDALAVLGNAAPLRDLRFQLDYQMVMGITYFNIHGLSYSFDGPRKDEVPPSLFYQHTEWKYMSTLMQHVKEIGAELTGGTHRCRIGVLYPAASIYCRIDANGCHSKLEPVIHQFSETMLSHQKDFDFIDEITLQECVDAAGTVNLPEPWEVIILPHLEYIERATADALEKLAASGIKVMIIGSRPALLGRIDDRPLADWCPDFSVAVDAIDDIVLKQLPGAELTGAGCNDVFVLQRCKNDRVVSFLVNRAEHEFNGWLDGHSVTIAPKGSLLLSGMTRKEEKVMSFVPLLRLDTDWKITFEPNQFQLASWQASRLGDLPDDRINLPQHEYNLLLRHSDPMGDGVDLVCYQTRFLWTGNNIPLTLVLEESTLGGDCDVYFNGVKVDKFTRERVYDCLNMTAEIGGALRTGTTPTLNVLKIMARNEGRGLLEMPYLYGDFHTEYRYGDKSLPILTAMPSALALPLLQDWGTLGYGGFSGTASYERIFELDAAGEFCLDLGRVEDVAAVFVDGNAGTVLAWQPYCCRLGRLAAGCHRLRVDLTNSPANRDRLAGLTAGLLGPVTLLRQEL